MWREVQARYGSAVAPGGVASDAELQEIWRRYRELRARVPEPAAGRLELCLTRFGVNHVLTTPHMLAVDLFEYAYDLVVRLACLGFLLNTRLADFAGSDAELDRQIVEATYCFVRTVEHADLPSALKKLLHQQRIDGLAHAVCFLSLFAVNAGSSRPTR